MALKATQKGLIFWRYYNVINMLVLKYYNVENMLALKLKVLVFQRYYNVKTYWYWN